MKNINSYKDKNNTYLRLRLAAIDSISYYEQKLKNLTLKFDDSMLEIHKDIESLMNEAEKLNILNETKKDKTLIGLSGNFMISKATKQIEKDYSILTQFIKDTNPEYIDEYGNIKWNEYKTKLSIDKNNKLVDDQKRVVEGLKLINIPEKIDILLK